MADYLEGSGRNIHGKRLADLLRSDRKVLLREPPGVMEGYGGAKLPYSPTFSPGENPEITLGDIAETAWDVVSPLGLYAGDVEAAKGKAAKGSFPAVRKTIAKLRGEEPHIGPSPVYHGSPHKFDKFDISKIGTGEGAQRYGHGIYLAENPEVALEYKKNLSSKYPVSHSGVIEENGKHLAWAKPIDGSAVQIVHTGATKKEAQQALRKYLDGKRGNVYKVDLPDDQRAKMLDWDKPLSQQAPEVQKALAGVDEGENLYRSLKAIHGTDDKVSAHLKSLGIPGIRYLDQGSRQGGQGTSNYVLFDDTLARIIERNGKKVAAQLRGKESAEYKVTPETPPSIMRALRDVEAPRETGLGKRFKEGEKAGIHRGTEAFGGIKNTGPMRAAYLRKMEEGVEGRRWYDETSEDILRLVGGDPKKADDLANMLATTSASTGVAPNTMYGFKGWNQQAVGDPLHVGQYPTRMSADILRTQESPEAAATGLKRNPFSAGLSVAWRPPGAGGIRPTHDIHDVRAWGINDPKTGEVWKKGIGEAGHRFLDEQADIVTRRANEQALGGAQDWTPYRAQAAAWIAQKAKHEGIPIEQAAKHYGDYIDPYSALVTREWVPGENTGHLAEMLRAPEAKRRAYSEEMEQLFRGPQGIDALANEMGLLSDVTLPNRGVYEGATNPGYASRIPVGLKTGGGEIDPSSATALNALASAHGMFGTQKQSAWNFAAGKSPISKANLLRVNRGSPYSEAELADLQAAVPGMDVPMVDPQGARVLEFGDRQAELIKVLRGAAPGAQIEPQALSGNLIPETPGEKFSYRPYIEGVEAGGPKMVEGFDRAAQTRAPQVLARTEAWAEREGWAQAPFFKDAMQILATKGLAGLKEAQRAGIVPAAFVTGIEGLEGLEDGR